MKPELLDDPHLWELERAHQDLPILRAFVGLWIVADREGRFVWEPRLLRAKLLPYWDGGDMDRVLNALASSNFIVKYVVNGRAYGEVRSFSKHQVINREPASSLPPPPKQAQTTQQEAAPAVPAVIVYHDGNKTAPSSTIITTYEPVPNRSLTGSEPVGKLYCGEGKGKGIGRESRNRAEAEAECARIGAPAPAAPSADEPEQHAESQECREGTPAPSSGDCLSRGYPTSGGSDKAPATPPKHGGNRYDLGAMSTHVDDVAIELPSKGLTRMMSVPALSLQWWDPRGVHRLALARIGAAPADEWERVAKGLCASAWVAKHPGRCTPRHIAERWSEYSVGKEPGRRVEGEAPKSIEDTYEKLD